MEPHTAICTALRSNNKPPSTKTSAARMNAHTRFALPMNTHSNLKFLHDKAHANADADRSDNKVAQVVTEKRQHRESKLLQKMKMLFPGKKIKVESALKEDEAVVNERKRSTEAQLVGSHAFVHMGRR